MSLLYSLPLIGAYKFHRDLEKQNRFLKEKISSNPHLEQEGLRGAIISPLYPSILTEIGLDITAGSGAAMVYIATRILHIPPVGYLEDNMFEILGSLLIFGGCFGINAYRYYTASIIRRYKKYGKVAVPVDLPTGEFRQEFLDPFLSPVTQRKTIEII